MHHLTAANRSHAEPSGGAVQFFCLCGNSVIGPCADTDFSTHSSSQPSIKMKTLRSNCSQLSNWPNKNRVSGGSFARPQALPAPKRQHFATFPVDRKCWQILWGYACSWTLRHRRPGTSLVTGYESTPRIILQSWRSWPGSLFAHQGRAIPFPAEHPDPLSALHRHPTDAAQGNLLPHKQKNCDLIAGIRPASARDKSRLFALNYGEGGKNLEYMVFCKELWHLHGTPQSQAGIFPALAGPSTC